MTTIRHALVLAAVLAVPGVADAQPPIPPVEPGRQSLDAPRAQRRGRAGIDERIRRAEERRGPEVTEAFSRTLTLGRSGTFELTNRAGAIVITGGRGDQVRIDAVKRARGPNEAQARELLAAVQIEVAERTGLVQVRSVFPRVRDLSASVDYTVALPDSSNVVVRGVSGGIRVTNVGGDLRAESVGGDVVLADVRRLRSVRSVSGDIEITKAEGQETAAGTVSGSVTVRGLDADAFTAESVSGAVRISDVEVDRVRLRSLSGDLEFTGRLARGGRYEMESHSGDIRVQPDGGFDVEASTFSGGVRSDLELRSAAGESGNGRPGRMLRGTRGDAGAILTLRAFSGDVTIAGR